MTFLSALGDLPEMLLGLAFSLGCALLLGFACLRLFMNLMTHHASRDHNGISDRPQVDSLLLLNAAVGMSNSGPGARTGERPDAGSGMGDNGATGVAYRVPAAAPRNRFDRETELSAVSASRVVEIPLAIPGRVAQSRGASLWSPGGCGPNNDDAA
jgi:hypothetical protein